MREWFEAGILGLNAGVISNAAGPFGRVKQPGLRREGGLDGIEEYLSTQNTGMANPSVDWLWAPAQVLGSARFLFVLRR